MNAIFDGIILGTGHNALILQAYLSRCGLKTLSVDRASIPGGRTRGTTAKTKESAERAQFRKRHIPIA